ncbi:hypothetical protein SCP_0210710 [Sparassis crispa]|uniref:Uncharacterized protein n=1 Tax=Sparassis crispa TaxID=139825 RepID=A0A401GCH0_9APHY|nr:hypothetical protein SCP_0210710 [Sparassis crispa]GBE79869.1 hypothetical protein SCP_0210710 [Sparassis crispa]
MGKWTLEYHDDVLRNKMKSLVTGAVKRIRLEHGEPLISYEAFVEELDEGDSFTASIIDVLVKEMAERRTRPNPIDRRLISERTAKTLRMQAAPLHIYRNRHNLGRASSRRSFPFMDYAAQAEDTQGSDDDDEFGSVVGGGNGPFEGVRLNTELFDAYNNAHELPDLPHYPHSEPTPLATGSPEPADGPRDRYGVTSPRPISPPILSSTYRNNNAWAMLGNSSSNLTRQSSIRRPARSRTVDFNEFTHHRRSNIRSLRDSGHADNTASASSAWRFRLRDESPSREEALAGLPAAPPARRFFPLSPWSQARNRREAGLAFPWTSETTEPGPSAPSARPADLSPGGTPSSSQMWYTLTATAAEASAAPPDVTAGSSDSAGDGRSAVAPRLRRGGVRAPESLLSRHVSPATEDSQGVAAGVQGGGTGTEASHSAVRDITPVEVVNWQRTGQLSTDFPTPRSLSPATAPSEEL